MRNENSEIITHQRPTGKFPWLNRNVVGMTVTSFLGDAAHEMVTAVLPGFLGTIGVAASALGWIEEFQMPRRASSSSVPDGIQTVSATGRESLLSATFSPAQRLQYWP
jgi:hypothetical protein